MTIPMPIATMLDLPELVVTGCDGGIEIVMLCNLPEDDEPANEDGSRPRSLSERPDLN